MNILIDARSLVDPHSGGVRRVATNLVETCCHQAGADKITLLTTGASRRELPFSLPQNVKHYHIPWRNKLLSASMMLGASLESFLPETYDMLFFPNLGFTGPLKTPYAVLIHDLSFLIEPKWFSRKERAWHLAVRPKRMIQNAKAVFTVSAHTAEDVKKLTGRKAPGLVLPMAHNALPASIAREEAAPYFFAFGSNDKRKNIVCLVEAMEELRRDTDVRLFVTGTQTWGKPYVKALGRLDDGELAGYLKGASALLYPSWYEGYGLPVHEAERLGVPVIASIAGALPETAPAGTMLIQPEKPHLWVAAMKSALLSRQRFVRQTEERTWVPAANIVLKTLSKY